MTSKSFISRAPSRPLVCRGTHRELAAAEEAGVKAALPSPPRELAGRAKGLAPERALRPAAASGAEVAWRVLAERVESALAGPDDVIENSDAEEPPRLG